VTQQELVQPLPGPPHTLARMKEWKIMRDYRRAAHTLTDTAFGIAHLYNILIAGWPDLPRRPTNLRSYETSLSTAAAQ
jgi:hypothetical protein